MNILGSLVAQLSGPVPSILDHIRAIYDKIPKSQTHRQPIRTSVLEDAIIKCARNNRVILLLDAINESQDMESIQASLLRLAREAKNLRVLITTTTTTLYSRQSHTFVLNISTSMMRNDIEAFIQYRLQHDDTLRNLSPKFKAEIEGTLLRNADGS